LSAIVDLAELRGIEPQWRALAELRGNAFITPEWMRCWFAHYGAEATPFVPVLKHADGSLRGLLPLALSRSGRPRVCRVAGGTLGDHFHPVCEQAEEPDVGAVAGQELARAGEAWSVVILDHADIERPWVAALAAGTGVRLRTLQRPAGQMPWIDLSEYGGWEEYLAGRSSNLRKQVRRLARLAAERHGMRLRRTEDPDDVRRDVEAFFALHDMRWEKRSSLQSERARGFFADFAAAALGRGWLRLWFLELEGQAAAAWLGWRVGDRYAYYNGGFDPAWSALSPGLLLMSKVIESAFAEGATQLDFLLGEEPYKLRLANRTRTVRDVTLARSLPHPASLVVTAEHGARRVGRLIPEGAQRRLGLSRRSMLRGRER
jgi:CelD/BcsL family acetyltransferase involved in cellulose biosynthesis